MTSSDVPLVPAQDDAQVAAPRKTILTATDVREKTFTSTRFKPGYDEDEVDAFLDEVENTIAGLHEQIAKLETQLRDAAAAEPVVVAAPVSAPAAPTSPASPGAVEMEEMLRRTLLLAQRTADEAVAEAREQADRTLSEANAEATRVVTDARARAEAAEREAASRSSALIADSDAQRRSLESKLQALRSFEQDYRARLRSYFELQLNELEAMAVPAATAADSLDGIGVSHDTESPATSSGQ